MNRATQPMIAAKYSQHLEDVVLKEDLEFKEVARKDARHFARENQPALEGDRLAHYTSKFKPGYEKLVAYVLQHLQPARHVAEAKMETDLAREKDAKIESEIKALERQNTNNRYALGDFHSGNIFRLAYIVLFLTGLIQIGETVYTAQALQITGGSLFNSFLIALAVSIGVFLLSHIAPLMYKAANTRQKKMSIAIGSLVLVTALFAVLAIFRMQVLERHGISTNPISFIIINLFFFIVSTLVSYYAFPSAQEIREKRVQVRLLRTIQECEKQIEILKNERQTLRTNLKVKIEEHLQVSHYADYLCKRIGKMYRETIELFKSTNLIYRKGVPDCFDDFLPEIEINHTITYISLK